MRCGYDEEGDHKGCCEERRSHARPRVEMWGHRVCCGGVIVDVAEASLVAVDSQQLY